MSLNGTIVLCGRSNNMTERFFDGRLTQLAIFDSALTPDAVGYLYRLVRITCTRRISCS
jgi:hypothetical protein